MPSHIITVVYWAIMGVLLSSLSTLAFRLRAATQRVAVRGQIRVRLFTSSDWSSLPFLVADTGISDEDVLQVSGTVSDLPSPFYVVGIAAIIVLGVGILQFSLGDLTKEVFSSCATLQNQYICHNVLCCFLYCTGRTSACSRLSAY